MRYAVRGYIETDREMTGEELSSLLRDINAQLEDPVANCPTSTGIDVLGFEVDVVEHYNI